MKSYLKWSLLWNSLSSSNSLKAWSSLNCSTGLQLSGSTWIFLKLINKALYSKSTHIVCLNTFTLHFPNENIPQSTQSSSICMRRVPSSQKKVALKGLIAMLTFIHSSFPDRKRSPEYPIFSEMKSSLKLVIVFELFEGMIGFEYIYFSFPDQKRSPGYPIFSDMKSSLQSLGPVLPGLSLSTGGRDLVASFSVLYRAQLTLRSAVFLRHATFQAFYMQFGIVNTAVGVQAWGRGRGTPPPPSKNLRHRLCFKNLTQAFSKNTTRVIPKYFFTLWLNILKNFLW